MRVYMVPFFSNQLILLSLLSRVLFIEHLNLIHFAKKSFNKYCDWVSKTVVAKIMHFSCCHYNIANIELCAVLDVIDHRAGFNQILDSIRSGLHFPSRVIPNDFKQLYSQLFCLALKQYRDSVGNKSPSLLVVSLGKTLNGVLPSLCGKQVMEPSSLPVVVAQSN